METDQLKELFEGIRDENRMYANTATRIGDAFLALLSYVGSFSSDKYLRKDIEDIAQKVITFLDGAYFGTFTSSIVNGTGAAIDKDGNAEVESLKVRSFVEVMDLIVNRQQALEGDQILTESDTIETVEDLGYGTYRLSLRRKWEGYFTAQVQNNVLRGIINTLSSGSGDYYTSWMRVNSVNTANNSIEVTLYPDDEVPAGKNYPPAA